MQSKWYRIPMANSSWKPRSLYMTSTDARQYIVLYNQIIYNMFTHSIHFGWICWYETRRHQGLVHTSSPTQPYSSMESLLLALSDPSSFNSTPWGQTLKARGGRRHWTYAVMNSSGQYKCKLMPGKTWAWLKVLLCTATGTGRRHPQASAYNNGRHQLIA